MRGIDPPKVVWASVFAIFILKETVRLQGLGAVLAALCGVMLVTGASLQAVQSGDIISLVSGVLSGLAIVQIRRLRQSESSLAVFFYFNVAGLPLALCSIWLSHVQVVAPDLSQLPALAAAGLTGVTGQLLMTYGYKELPAAQGSIIVLSAVLLSALLSHVLFRDPFTIGTLGGGTLILGAAIVLLLSNHARRDPVASGT